MIALYVIYGLLIVTAIIFIPLRIRNRRRILQDINSLRLKYNQDMSQLMEVVEGKTDKEPQEGEKLKIDTISHPNHEVWLERTLVTSLLRSYLREFEESKVANWQLQLAREPDAWVTFSEKALAGYGTELKATRIAKRRPESALTHSWLPYTGRRASIAKEPTKLSLTCTMHRSRPLEPVP